jgi:hypothetical protein
MNENTTRRTASPWQLLQKAAGGPLVMAQKLQRLTRTIRGYGNRKELHRRLDRLVSKGIIETAPTGVQLFVGAADMLRFWISPAAAEYYESMGIDYGFHQVLRFLDEPSSVADPVGFFSTRNGIIGHLMQTVHANPHYDLELLEMFDDGLDELERQVEMMLNGTHPRHESIGAIVEEPDYHARLLEYTRSFKKNRYVAPPIRDNVATNPHWQDIERTFGSLRTSMRYFCRLPKEPRQAAWHLLTVKTFPVEEVEENEGCSPSTRARGNAP